MPDQIQPATVSSAPEWSTPPAQTLPVAAMLYFPNATGSGPAQIAVPAGTPVHAVGSGRVTDADTERVGEVVIRLELGMQAHYRRLAPSSVKVRRGDVVTSGQLIGVVAPVVRGGAGDGGLVFGLQSDDDRWLDPIAGLTGATDPAQFGVPALRRSEPDASASLVTSVSSARAERTRPAPAAESLPEPVMAPADASTRLARRPLAPIPVPSDPAAMPAVAAVEHAASPTVDPVVERSPAPAPPAPAPTEPSASPEPREQTETAQPTPPSRLVSRRPRPRTT